MTTNRWEGYRNVFLIVFFFAWSSAMTWMFEPPSGSWTPELITAVATFLGTTGATLVLAILGRAANKWASNPGGTSSPEEKP